MLPTGLLSGVELPVTSKYTSSLASVDNCEFPISSVFNISQIDGLELVEATPPTEVERHETAERFIKATEAKIAHGGDRAFYTSVHDSITLPHPGRL
jgi:antirestriction protein ArdC